ncbi:hypothetical protein D3C73_184920 [compost metagenome]
MAEERCVGCHEYKESSELKLLQDELLCRSCRNAELINQEFYKLEEKEGILTDRMVDQESVVFGLTERLKKENEKLESIRNQYYENELSKVRFEWDRWILDEPSKGE